MFNKIFEKLQELWNAYKSEMKECINCFVKSFHEVSHGGEYIVLLIVIAPMLVACMVFIPLIILLVFIFLIVKRFVKECIAYYMKLCNSLTGIYTEYFVSEILFGILKDNAGILEVIPPISISDIIPVHHKLTQIENSFPYYHFIVQHQNNENYDFSDAMNLLNLKLSQYLQMYCNNYPITYAEEQVLKVFRITESSLHPRCYSIYLMVIDSNEKLAYLRSLDIAKGTQTTVTLDDEEF